MTGDDLLDERKRERLKAWGRAFLAKDFRSPIRQRHGPEQLHRGLIPDHASPSPECLRIASYLDSQASGWDTEAKKTEDLNDYSRFSAMASILRLNAERIRRGRHRGKEA